MKKDKLQPEVIIAIRNRDLNQVTSLIESNPGSLKMMTPLGSWLHIAARFGNLEMVRHLVEMGADLNIRGGILEGNALQEAVSAGHLDIVKYLRSEGANIDTQRSEWNPLFSAIYNDHREIARFLIDCGIDTKKKYTGKYMKNMGALEFALEQGKLEIADMLRNVG